MKIVLVIPTYKNAEALKDILSQRHIKDFSHVYILDDKSDDDEIIKFASKHVSVIPSTKRLFVTPNRNRILNYDIGDILVYLDSDALIKTDTVVSVLTDSFSKDKHLGILSGELRRLNGAIEWYSYGKFLSPFDMQKLEAYVTIAEKNINNQELQDLIKKHAGPLSYDLWSLEKEQYVDWTSGAFYAVRSFLFKSLGGFDPQFVMYHEEPDLCLRAKRLGYNTLWTPKIKILHKKLDNVGSNVRNSFMHQSTKLWYRKHFSINEDVFDRLENLTLTS